MSSVINWSSYKRKQVNISKSVRNDKVSELLTIHYKYLHSLLVRIEQDEDIFNDTYLKLTYNYNPSVDFIEQFKYYFNYLKGAYYRDDKVANYYLGLDSAADIADNPTDDTDQPTDKPKLTSLKANIQEYANFKKSQKRADKTDK